MRKGKDGKRNAEKRGVGKDRDGRYGGGDDRTAMRGSDGSFQRGGDADGKGSEIPGKFRERFDRLSPDAKRRFMANWTKWRKMEPREREEVIERALDERVRMDRVIDEALAKLGLDLTPDELEVFELRYRQERRKLEEGLRDEMNEMRKVRVEAMLRDLGVEFAAAGPIGAGEAAPEGKDSPAMENAPDQAE